MLNPLRYNFPTNQKTNSQMSVPYTQKISVIDFYFHQQNILFISTTLQIMCSHVHFFHSRYARKRILLIYDFNTLYSQYFIFCESRERWKLGLDIKLRSIPKFILARISSGFCRRRTFIFIYMSVVFADY